MNEASTSILRFIDRNSIRLASAKSARLMRNMLSLPWKAAERSLIRRNEKHGAIRNLTIEITEAKIANIFQTITNEVVITTESDSLLPNDMSEDLSRLKAISNGRNPEQWNVAAGFFMVGEMVCLPTTTLKNLDYPNHIISSENEEVIVSSHGRIRLGDLLEDTLIAFLADTQKQPTKKDDVIDFVSSKTKKFPLGLDCLYVCRKMQNDNNADSQFSSLVDESAIEGHQIDELTLMMRTTAVDIVYEEISNAYKDYIRDTNAATAKIGKKRDDEINEILKSYIDSYGKETIDKLHIRSYLPYYVRLTSEEESLRREITNGINAVEANANEEIEKVKTSFIEDARTKASKTYEECAKQIEETFDNDNK
jgi:hypothetical protein